MLPRIQPNSFIIAIYWPRFLTKRVGQMYYLNHPRYGYIVKTLDCIENDFSWFRGESNESAPREAIGAVKSSQIIGRVIWVITS